MERMEKYYREAGQEIGQQPEKSTVIMKALESLESHIRSLEELSERVEHDAVSNKPSDQVSEKDKISLAGLLNFLPQELEELGKRINTACLRLTENLF